MSANKHDSLFPPITVRNFPAQVLLALARQEIGLTHVEPEYDGWDFVRDEGDRTYEVMTAAPGSFLFSVCQVREHFADFGFHGNAQRFSNGSRRSVATVGMPPCRKMTGSSATHVEIW
jgi:hypothetical protein